MFGMKNIWYLFRAFLIFTTLMGIRELIIESDLVKVIYPEEVPREKHSLTKIFQLS